MAFRSFPSLPRVTLKWEILGSAMLGSSTAPATCVTLSRVLHFSEPPQAQSRNGAPGEIKWVHWCAD